jgi:predicted transcriptional regulator
LSNSTPKDFTTMPDPTAVLVSVHPTYARAIAAGEKRVELRRRFPMVKAGAWLVLYATLPIGAIVGMARSEGVDRLAPEDLWRQHQRVAGVSKEAFDAYFEGCAEAVGVRLGSFVAVQAVAHAQLSGLLPGLRPPQSFRYLGAAVMQALHARVVMGS